MIKDSGERTKFESGAVRDMHEGKGDMASIPWESICACLSITKTERKSIRDGTSEREYQSQALSTPLAVILQNINAEWTTKITSLPLLLMFWAQC